MAIENRKKKRYEAAWNLVKESNRNKTVYERDGERVG